MRVLIVTSRFPLPAWRGNQVRTVEWLRALKGHERHIACPRPPDPAELVELDPIAEATHPYRLPRLARAAAAIAASLTGRPVQEGMYATPDARRVVRRTIGVLRPEVVVVQMVRCGWALEVVREHAPDAGILFDAIDSMGLHFERGSRGALVPWRPLWLAESARCRRRERELAGSSELTTAVSDRDLEALLSEPARGMLVPVAGRDMGRATPDRDRPTVLLSGNLGYRPTVDAAKWFARHVWPQLAIRLPAARWLLVGARPPRAIRRLGRLPNVEVHSNVADLAPFLGQATVAIAPMAIGSGVPMKVIEAWSAAVPVVTEPWSAAGLGPEASDAVAVASSVGDWVDALTSLLGDDEARCALGERGHQQWNLHYRRDRVFESVRRAVSRVAEARHRT
jgi:glycosyltransferase involved in cell wall biosynthesis